MDFESSRSPVCLGATQIDPATSVLRYTSPGPRAGSLIPTGDNMEENHALSATLFKSLAVLRGLVAKPVHTFQGIGLPG